MMSVDSAVRLGWALVRVLAGKLLPSRSQLPRFFAQYGGDGIVAFEAVERAAMDGASRCTACGQCDRVATMEHTMATLGPRGPMAFVLGVSRHSGEHDMAQLEGADGAVLARLTEVCPVGVPFAPLVEMVRRRADRLSEARALATR